MTVSEETLRDVIACWHPSDWGPSPSTAEATEALDALVAELRAARADNRVQAWQLSEIRLLAAANGVVRLPEVDALAAAAVALGEGTFPVQS